MPFASSFQVRRIRNRAPPSTYIYCPGSNSLHETIFAYKNGKPNCSFPPSPSPPALSCHPNMQNLQIFRSKGPHTGRTGRRRRRRGGRGLERMGQAEEPTRIRPPAHGLHQNGAPGDAGWNDEAPAGTRFRVRQAPTRHSPDSGNQLTSLCAVFSLQLKFDRLLASFSF